MQIAFTLVASTLNICNIISCAVFAFNYAIYSCRHVHIYASRARAHTQNGSNLLCIAKIVDSVLLENWMTIKKKEKKRKQRQNENENEKETDSREPRIVITAFYAIFSCFQLTKKYCEPQHFFQCRHNAINACENLFPFVERLIQCVVEEGMCHKIYAWES